MKPSVILAAMKFRNLLKKDDAYDESDAVNNDEIVK